MAQQAVEKVGVEKHNFARTGRMALYGGGILPIAPFESPQQRRAGELTVLPQSYSAQQQQPGSPSSHAV